MISTPPDRSEAASYYFTYIDRVPAGDIIALLHAQDDDVTAFARGISDTQAAHRYAPDKWSIREVVGHLSDCERLFVGRAFWFARGFDTPLPSFDQNVAIATAGSDARAWSSLVGEFHTVRAASISFFESLPAAAWSRRGIASDNPFTVRALAYMTVGHVIQHLDILRERYLTR
jgi:hypothetical protein